MKQRKRKCKTCGEELFGGAVEIFKHYYLCKFFQLQAQKNPYIVEIKKEEKDEE